MSKEIRDIIYSTVRDEKFDFFLMNCHNDAHILAKMMYRNFPDGAEIFTNELVGVGDFSRNKSKARRSMFDLAHDYDAIIHGAGAGCVYHEILYSALESDTKLWLGAPYVDRGLYNAYVGLSNRGIEWISKKKYIWDGEPNSEIGIFSVFEYEGKRPVSTINYSGIYLNRAILICQEAAAFYNPKWRRRTSIPEIREVKPDFVIIPAQWKEKELLKKIALSISRRIKDPIDKQSAVREQGCLTFVINDHETYVCGPVEGKRQKAKVLAYQDKVGWIRVNNYGIEVVDVIL